MAKLYALNRQGHGLMAEWEKDDAVKVKAANDQFAELAAKGFTMFSVADGGTTEKLKSFDPAAKEIIAVPQLVGG